MVKRFGISLDDDLLSGFDTLISRKGYQNRSEAIRDLIREALMEEDWRTGERIGTGIVMIVYDHHQYNLAQKVTGLQHSHYQVVVSSLHTHLDAHNCLEVIILKGKGGVIREIADNIISTRGVQFGRFIPAATEKKPHKE
ncbi:MAG TPA: nickel-responsive transcriptional regulator NikR [Spirochaetia bacterium]|nr:nickel-responsive transcriptional regulator NikR [Spirochaetia bacterium]